MFVSRKSQFLLQLDRPQWVCFLHKIIIFNINDEKCAFTTEF